MPEQIGAAKDGSGTKYRLSDAETALLREAVTKTAADYRAHGNVAKAAEFNALAQYAGQVRRITVVV